MAAGPPSFLSAWATSPARRVEPPVAARLPDDVAHGDDGDAQLVGDGRGLALPAARQPDDADDPH